MVMSNDKLVDLYYGSKVSYCSFDEVVIISIRHGETPRNKTLSDGIYENSKLGRFSSNYPEESTKTYS